MSGEDFLVKMNDIDEDLLEAAAAAPRKQLHLSAKWLAAAACLILVLQLGILKLVLNGKRSDLQNTVVAFSLEGADYVMPSLNDYVRYGLLQTDILERSSLNLAPLSSGDRGEKMGVVEIQSGEKTVKCKVYHFAAYPDDDSICLFELPGGTLQLYVRKE